MSADEFAQGHPTSLVPTCDRCGRLAKHGSILDTRTMETVCLGCLTDDEACGASRQPRSEESD